MTAASVGNVADPKFIKYLLDPAADYDCYIAVGNASVAPVILQHETRKVFASPHFLELTSDAFVKILEQEALNVKEVEIWRNALLWAKHKANCEDGDKLRKELVKPLKHIRLCTLSPEDICKEVLPKKILSVEECAAVGISLGNQQIQPELTEICSAVEVRKHPNGKSKLLSKVVTTGVFPTYSFDCNITLETKGSGLELSSLSLCVTGYGTNNGFQFNFTVNIEQVDRPETETSVTYTAHSLDGEVTIPVSTEEREVLLLPNSQYDINITCNYKIDMYKFSSLPDNDHFSISYSNNGRNKASHSIKRVGYKTLNT